MLSAVSCFQKYLHVVKDLHIQALGSPGAVKAAVYHWPQAQVRELTHHWMGCPPYLHAWKDKDIIRL